MLWTDVPDEISFGRDGSNTFGTSKVTLITMVGNSERSKLEEEMKKILEMPLINSHRAEWTYFWNMHKIDVYANQTFSRLVTCSLFYLANSMPVIDAYTLDHEFNGIGATGLGVPGDRGHIDYETELYLQLPLVLIYPEWSHDFIRYRLKSLAAALENANTLQIEGAKFSYRSGYTGAELSADIEEIAREIHVTADIGLALRHHFSATYNLEFLRDEGCQLATEIGKYWAKLLVKNGDNYELKGNYDFYINDDCGMLNIWFYFRCDWN